MDVSRRFEEELGHGCSDDVGAVAHRPFAVSRHEASAGEVHTEEGVAARVEIGQHEFHPLDRSSWQPERLGDVEAVDDVAANAPACPPPGRCQGCVTFSARLASNSASLY